MSLNTRSLLILLSLFLFAAAASNSQAEILDSILNTFKHDTKKLFKVWHFLFNKEYDVNTLEGLSKYKTFKKNLKEIEAHNSNKGTYTYEMGLNHLSDMTFEEVVAYYNLKPIREEELARGIRNLNSFNLDDYNDEDEVATAPTKTPVKRRNHDHRNKMRPVRDQGSCGSCWAFATHSIIEGAHIIKGSNVTDHFSTQHSVDCDKGNKGCNGGWYDNALKFFSVADPVTKINRLLIYEKDYPYVGKAGVCKEKEKKNSGFGISSYLRYDYRGRSTTTIDALLENGPYAAVVNAETNLMRYKKGIFNGPCFDGFNHAVVVVGYNPGSEAEVAHYIVRNSWGLKWGDQGHIRISASADFDACNIEKVGYQPVV